MTHGKTGPLSEDLGVRDLDQLDVVLGAKSLNELEVLGYITISILPQIPPASAIAVAKRLKRREAQADTPSVTVSTKTHK